MEAAINELLGHVSALQSARGAFPNLCFSLILHSESLMHLLY